MRGFEDTETRDNALAALGLVLVDAPPPTVFGVWQDNVFAFNVFRRLCGQWRTAGMGGLMALDYAALPFVLDLEGVPRARWAEVVDGVQAMETEALRLIRKDK